MALVVHIYQDTPGTFQNLRVSVVGACDDNPLATLQNNIQQHLNLIPVILSLEDPAILCDLDGPYYVMDRVRRSLKAYDAKATWSLTYHNYDDNIWKLSYLKLNQEVAEPHVQAKGVSLWELPELVMGWPFNGLICSICEKPQVTTPGGTSCPDGHGGVEGIKPLSKNLPRVEDYDGSGVPGFKPSW